MAGAVDNSTMNIVVVILYINHCRFCLPGKLGRASTWAEASAAPAELIRTHCTASSSSSSSSSSTSALGMKRAARRSTSPVGGASLLNIDLCLSVTLSCSQLMTPLHQLLLLRLRRSQPTVAPFNPLNPFNASLVVVITQKIQCCTPRLPVYPATNSTDCSQFSMLPHVSCFRHVTPLLRDLHWLLVPQRVEYKLAILVYRCPHGLTPSYLADDLHLVADFESRQRLRSPSSDALVVPPTRLCNVGDRAFPVSAARVWNGLPAHVTSSPSLTYSNAI